MQACYGSGLMKNVVKHRSVMVSDIRIWT